MRFKVIKIQGFPDPGKNFNSLLDEIIWKGNELIDPLSKSDFVLNLIDLDNPKAYVRKGQEEKVISIALLKTHRTDMKSACYIALVKTLSNMLFSIVDDGRDDNVTGYSITPEVGFVRFRFSPERMFEYMLPVISSHFVLRNKIDPDLDIKEEQKIPEIDDLIFFAKELKVLGVLPAPFPLTKYLDQHLIDHLFRLYQIKGLSYGNMSIRNDYYKTEGTSFWMTARGVDKSQLEGLGKDLLLIKGYDEMNGEMLISVPPAHDPRVRVSVDAIEHYMIYRDFPQTGAIVHLHAWIDNIPCTTQTYPCGTRELAENVVELLRSTPDPGRAEIGLKNHGITITGTDIRDIFTRIKGRLKITVPMFD
jgi:hypothetical protein